MCLAQDFGDGTLTNAFLSKRLFTSDRFLQTCSVLFRVHHAGVSGVTVSNTLAACALS